MEFSTLTEAQVAKIHEKSCRVLSEIGSVVDHEGARKLLGDAGATVDGKRVYIPESLVNKAIKSAPGHFELYDRHEKLSMSLGEYHAYFGTGSDTLGLIDFKTGERKKWTKKDIEKGILLCDYLENIDFIMSLGIISDVDINLNTREQYAAMIRNSSKPQVVVCDDVNDFNDIVLMAAAARGSLDNLKKKPLFILYCEPSSPLVNSFHAVDNLLTSAEYGIPVNYATGGMSGGTTPITAEGTILLSNAECLLGLVLHQLKNPGAPFLYGFGNAPLDLRTMQSVYASPIAMQVQGGMCDLSRFYDLPSWGEAGCSSSKVCDEQSAVEAAHFILMAQLQGCNVTHDVGYLDFGLSYSYEHLFVCNEIIGRARATLKELTDDEFVLGYEAIKRVGHGGNYLADQHTVDNMRQAWSGGLSDYRSFDNWKSDGGKTMGQRAHQKVMSVLSEHKPDPLLEEVDRKIGQILEDASKKFGSK